MAKSVIAKMARRGDGEKRCRDETMRRKAYLDPDFFGLTVMVVLGDAAIDGQLFAWWRAIVVSPSRPLPIFDLLFVHLG